jgi:ABC-2 type transport system permease protein
MNGRSGWNLRRLRAVATKEWTHLRRDPRSLGTILLLPIVTLVLYGYAINFDLRHIPVGVLDHDRTPQSRRLRNVLESTDYLDFRGEFESEDQVRSAIEQGRVRAAIVIPARFAATIAAGRSAPVQSVFDGSDSTTAGVAEGYVQQAVARFAEELGRDAALKHVPKGLRTGPSVDVYPRFLYNPTLSSTRFIVPGLLVVILSITAALLTSTCVAREREQGTLEALVVSPLQPGELMLGKLIPYVILGFVDVSILIVFGYILFGVWPAGSVLLLMGGMVLFLIGVLSLGLLISSLARSQTFALQLGFVATFLPTMLLSGFAYPRRSMPDIIYYLTAALPATQFLIFVRGVYLKAVGLGVLWPQVLWLGVTAAVILRVAAKRFVKRLD